MLSLTGSPIFIATLDKLASLYPTSTSSQRNDVFSPETYHPDLKALYGSFLENLYSICSPSTTDPDELAYIAAARWPGFVKPLLDERYRLLEAGHSEDEVGFHVPLEVRLQLLRIIKPTFTGALKTLYPRHASAMEWARCNLPPEDISTMEQGKADSRVAHDAEHQNVLLSQSLPRMAKFILVSAFLASTNPAKSDLRMFGRGPDERKKRRKKGGAVRKLGKSGAVKACPFSLSEGL